MIATAAGKDGVLDTDEFIELLTTLAPPQDDKDEDNNNSNSKQAGNSSA